MAVIKPFRGMRFNTQKAGGISSLCCPPYDIISEEQRAEFLARNEYNIIRLELPEEGENPYLTAADVLDMWRKNGVLIYDDKPAIYVYEMEFTAYGEQKRVKGIIARVRLEEFSKGIILPHEFTLSGAKEDRLKLMKATNCNFSQIYALYMDETHTTLHTIEDYSRGKAQLEMCDGDGVIHRLWIVTDEQAIAKLTADFAYRRLYIADGHHRYETALNYRDYCRENGLAKEGDPCDYQMIFLTDMEHPGLCVFPTHRLVYNLPDFDRDKVLDGCKKYFDVTRRQGTDDMEDALAKLYNEGKKAFGFYCGNGEWYLLTLKSIDVMDEILPDMCVPSRRLDVSVLHSLILERIFGIDKENMAKQKNLKYTKQFSHAISSVDSGKYQCAFVLNPTRVTEIRDVAAAGEKMPQKSTYFYPKMITGMVMNDLNVE